MTEEFDQQLQRKLGRLAAAVPSSAPADQRPDASMTWPHVPGVALVVLTGLLLGALGLRWASPNGGVLAPSSPRSTPLSLGSPIASAVVVGETPPQPSARLFETAFPVSANSTATVMVRDLTDFVVGVDAVPDFKMTSDEYRQYSDRNMIALPVANSDDIYVLWSTGVCQPSQIVTFTGAAADLHLDIDEGPISTSPCDLMGTGIAIRLHLSVPVDLTTVTYSRT